MKKVLKWITILLAALNFGFMTYDGSRALIVGDYVRPETGEYAGKLGPWSEVAIAIGIDPESTQMKWTFLIWGGLGLIIMVSYAMGIRGAKRALIAINILSLWYLVIGTVSSIIQLILLAIMGSKKKETI